MIWCLDIDTMAKQFISYLQKTFPNAKLSLHLHESGKSYLKYLQQQQLPYPNVVTTIDSQDGHEKMSESGLDFTELVEAILINNSTASVIQFQKKCQYETVTFSNISRDQKENATKKLIGEGDKQIEVYCQSETF